MARITKEFAKVILKENGISGNVVDDALKKCLKFSARCEIEYSEKGIDDFIEEYKEKKA